MTTRDSIFAGTSGLGVGGAASANNRPTWRNLVLRGGRVTKYKGIGCGIAPHCGAVASVGFSAAAASVVSLAAMLLPSTAAVAGVCGPGVDVVCAGPANPATDVQQDYTVNDQSLTITTQPGFGLDSPDYGFSISASGTGDVTFIDENASSIRADGRALDINANGLAGKIDVKSTGELVGEGIYGLYVGAGQQVTSTMLDLKRVESENYVGLLVENAGGALTVKSSEAIIGGSNSGVYRGLQIENASSATGGILVDVADVSGSDDGIVVSQQGIGLVDIRSSGEVKGYDNGIEVSQIGIGAVNIAAQGSVTAEWGNGIYVGSGNRTTGVTIEARNASGGVDGIAVDDFGTGIVDIRSEGLVKGGVTGVRVNTSTASAGVVVDINDATGGRDGIWIDHRGGGDVEISANDVEGTSRDGLNIETLAASRDMTIEARNVTGGRNGIWAFNRGTGDLEIATTGKVTGTSGTGILAETSGGGNLSVNANDAEGGLWGIYGKQYGTGELRIVSTGTVTGTAFDGIRADNNGTGLVIEARDATGGNYGIYVPEAGSGTVDIDVTGTATGGVDGIRVVTESDTKSVRLDVNNAIGGNNGITVIHNADSSADANDVAITVTGRIQGGGAGGWGISTQSRPGVVSNITVKGTATVGSASDRAIMNDDGNSYIVVEDARTFDNPDTPEVETSSVNGLVWLQGGNDNVDLYGGFSGITALDGGSGTDRLQLFDAADATYAGADIRYWEVFRLSNSRVKITGNSLAVGTPGDATTGVFLTNGSVFDLSGERVFNLDSNLTLAAGTTYLGYGDGGGDNTIYGDVTNAGLMSLAGTGAGDTLTIRRDYAGNGGTVEIDTVLGDDSSQTDQLVIWGNSSGTSNVRVNNLGGAGAPTVEGIKIIDVGGASDGVFSLVGDYEIGGKQAVVAGAYGYTLWKNGISTPGDGDWYLRSWADGGPIYQPGAPIYETYAQALLGMNGLPTLQQRVGDRYWNDAPKSEKLSSSEAAPVTDNGVWGVIEGSYGKFQPDSSTTGSEYDQDIWRMRFGIDGLISESEAGKFIGGIMAQFGRGSTSISSEFGPGDIASDAYGVGATATWYGNSGLYLDGQAQVTWFDSDLSSDWVGDLASGNNGSGYALSMEAGRRVDAGKDWTLIPQAQLVYSNVRFDSFTDLFGAEVEKDQADSLRARFGLAVEQQTSWADEQGEIARTAIHGIANVYYEVLDGTSVSVAGTEIESQNDRAWGEIGVGGSYNWGNDAYALYGELSTSSSFQNFADSYTVKGTAGLRINW